MPSPPTSSLSRERPVSAARSGFLWRHLVGDYSLGRSFWVHTVLLGDGVVFATGMAIGAIGRHSAARYVSMGVLVAEPLLLLCFLWSMAGTTISALRKLQGGPGRFWALLAMAMMVLGLFGVTNGLHRGKPVGASGDDGGPPDTDAAIYRKAGLREAFVRRIVATPNSSIFIPTRKELLDEAVLTR